MIGLQSNTSAAPTPIPEKLDETIEKATVEKLNPENEENGSEMATEALVEDDKFKRPEPQAQDSAVKPKREKVKDYKWLYYDIVEHKEVDYLGDFLYLTSGKKLNKFRLGLHQEKKKKKNADAEGLGKRDLPININSSSKKVMDVANNILERLMKYGRLDDGKNLITKKTNSNINAYQKDDFIEDPEETMIADNMEQFEAQYEDFFVVKGDMSKFERSSRYLDRIQEINSRNRVNKNRETQRIKRNNRRRQENNELKMLQNTDIQQLRDKIDKRNELKESNKDDEVEDGVEKKLKA